ncbi:MAG: ATP-binding cassette domain-containing protein [Gammaproteobacteria bacterium]|nr:ATP-binding cassette domain-containing protein [Gammaproteobacteria bacterium]
MNKTFTLRHASTAPVPAHAPPRLRISELSVSYRGKPAMHRASLNVPPGSLMGVVGPSGCGKSSLLAAMGRMTDLIPGCSVSGSVIMDDEELLAPGVDALRLRKNIGLVFQQPNPFPLSVAENIRFPLREHGVRDRHELADRTEAVLRRVGLWNEVSDRLDMSALRLSGGQQQRLCIARALALQPRLLLLDEPCSALDPVASSVVEELILSLKGHYTMLMVTHNLAQARRIADGVTVCWFQEGCGCVLESGWRTLFEKSSHPLTRQYLNSSAV